MHVSYQWLKDYVEIDIDPQELAHRLTLAGLAVDVVEDLGADIEKVVTGLFSKLKDTPMPTN